MLTVIIEMPTSPMIYPGIGRSNATSILTIRFVTLGISLHSSDYVSH